METSRRSEEVVNHLLRTMSETVTSYHPTVKRTSCTIDGLIAGTACYPGGAGLWRGEANGGRLPECFPQSPVMFVAHNFDSNRGFALSFADGAKLEGNSGKGCSASSQVQLSPDEYFFTNALMGLKPGRAEGDMPSVAGYKDQCQHYLKQQVEIVNPRAVIALGVTAEKYVSLLDCASLAAILGNGIFGSERLLGNIEFHTMTAPDRSMLTGTSQRIGDFVYSTRRSAVEW
jgi:hypothetical protein